MMSILVQDVFFAELRSEDDVRLRWRGPTPRARVGEVALARRRGADPTLPRPRAGNLAPRRRGAALCSTRHDFALTSHPLGRRLLFAPSRLGTRRALAEC
jgi:hypothetical protein